MIYRQVQKTAQRWVPGTETYVPGTDIGHAAGPGVGSGGVAGSSGYVSGSPGHYETYTYMDNEPVISDYNLPFIVYRDNVEVFRGNTPIKITGLDPGVTYKINWTTIEGNQNSGTFEITSTTPFTRSIHVE